MKIWFTLLFILEINNLIVANFVTWYRRNMMKIVTGVVFIRVGLYSQISVAILKAETYRRVMLIPP